MKIIVLFDWSDDQSKMPEKPGCSNESLYRSRRIMKSFEIWRQRQNRSYQLVLWHMHYPDRFVTPQNLPEGAPLPFDCTANLLEKQAEAIAKNYDPNEPIFIADDSFFFSDDFDMEPLIEQAMRPGSGVVSLNNAWILGPETQRVFCCADTSRYEKDWTEADFLDWINRTTWTFAKTYADTSPHEYAVLGKPNTELFDLYQATMFILRNGFVQMYYQTPFMAYELAGRRYWTYLSYELVNRTLQDDLKTYR